MVHCCFISHRLGLRDQGGPLTLRCEASTRMVQMTGFTWAHWSPVCCQKLLPSLVFLSVRETSYGVLTFQNAKEAARLPPTPVRDRVSCSLYWPLTYCVAEDDPEFLILLPLPPKSWSSRCVPPCLTCACFVCLILFGYEWDFLHLCLCNMYIPGTHGHHIPWY